MAPTPITDFDDDDEVKVPALTTAQSDPIEELKVGDEIYTLYMDYSVCRAITRKLGINPIAQGMFPVLQHIDGLATTLWAMISQCSPEQPVPGDHRNLKIKTVEKWFEKDLRLAQPAMEKVILVARAALQPPPAEEGEDSGPPKTEESDDQDR